jgi:hypothetical protein
MVALLFLLVGSIGSWYFVFNKRVRDNHSKALKGFYRLRKDQRQMFEASGFAAMLVAAIFFSILFVVLLVMQIINRL